ncbi:hypothetical protein VTK26DRAFT_1825 [Humicola hyalothermophila]
MDNDTHCKGEQHTQTALYAHGDTQVLLHRHSIIVASSHPLNNTRTLNRSISSMTVQHETITRCFEEECYVRICLAGRQDTDRA